MLATATPTRRFGPSPFWSRQLLANSNADEARGVHMEMIWERIEAWLSHNAPLVFQSLRGGATEHDIISAEVVLGNPLPSDYRESLKRHDGQVLDQFGCSPGFTYGLNLYPLAKTLSRKQGL